MKSKRMKTSMVMKHLDPKKMTIPMSKTKSDEIYIYFLLLSNSNFNQFKNIQIYGNTKFVTL